MPEPTPPQTARYHLHVISATGSGKSTLLTHLILGDAPLGAARWSSTPQGDLVTDVESRFNKADRDRAVLLDPQVPDGRPTLNMLEVPEGVGNDLVVVERLVGMFGRIFERHWGARLEDVLRSMCLTLLQRERRRPLRRPQAPRRPGAYANYLTPSSNEELHGFWKWYEALGEAQHRPGRRGRSVYKRRAFLLRPFVREIVVAPTSTINMGELLDGGLLPV